MISFDLMHPYYDTLNVPQIVKLELKKITITNIWHSTPISTIGALFKWHELDINKYQEASFMSKKSCLIWETKRHFAINWHIKVANHIRRKSWHLLKIFYIYHKWYNLKQWSQKIWKIGHSLQSAKSLVKLVNFSHFFQNEFIMKFLDIWMPLKVN